MPAGEFGACCPSRPTEVSARDRVGRVPPQRRLGHEVAPSSGGKGEAADRGPRPSRKHRGPPRVLAELHSVSCPHWLGSDGTRGKGKDAEAARRTAAALASHPPLLPERRTRPSNARSGRSTFSCVQNQTSSRCFSARGLCMSFPTRHSRRGPC